MKISFMMQRIKINTENNSDATKQQQAVADLILVERKRTLHHLTFLTNSVLVASSGIFLFSNWNTQSKAEVYYGAPSYPRTQVKWGEAPGPWPFSQPICLAYHGGARGLIFFPARSGELA